MSNRFEEKFEVDGLNMEDIKGVIKLISTSKEFNSAFHTSEFLEEKIEITDSLVKFLESYMAFLSVSSKSTVFKEKKLEILRLIGKLKMESELIKLKSGQQSLSKLKASAKNLEKKAQSAFSD